jgi:hypothetical protein
MMGFGGARYEYKPTPQETLFFDELKNPTAPPNQAVRYAIAETEPIDAFIMRGGGIDVQHLFTSLDDAQAVASGLRFQSLRGGGGSWIYKLVGPESQISQGRVSTEHIQGGLRVYEDGTLFPGPAKNPKFSASLPAPLFLVDARPPADVRSSGGFLPRENSRPEPDLTGNVPGTAGGRFVGTWRTAADANTALTQHPNPAWYQGDAWIYTVNPSGPRNAVVAHFESAGEPIGGVTVEGGIPLSEVLGWRRVSVEGSYIGDYSGNPSYEAPTPGKIQRWVGVRHPITGKEVLARVFKQNWPSVQRSLSEPGILGENALGEPNGVVVIAGHEPSVEAMMNGSSAARYVLGTDEQGQHYVLPIVAGAADPPPNAPDPSQPGSAQPAGASQGRLPFETDSGLLHVEDKVGQHSTWRVMNIARFEYVPTPDETSFFNELQDPTAPPGQAVRYAVAETEPINAFIMGGGGIDVSTPNLFASLDDAKAAVAGGLSFPSLRGGAGSWIYKLVGPEDQISRGHVSTGHIQGGLRVYEDGAFFPGPAKNPNFSGTAVPAAAASSADLPQPTTPSPTRPPLTMPEAVAFRDVFDDNRRAIANYMQGAAQSRFVPPDVGRDLSALMQDYLLGNTTPIARAIEWDSAYKSHAEEAAKQHIRDFVASRNPDPTVRSLSEQLLGEYLSGAPPASSRQGAQAANVNSAGGVRLVVGGGKGWRDPHPGEIFLDVSPQVRPHVISDVRNPGIANGAVDEIHFENVDAPLFAGPSPAAIDQAARVLRPGGRVVIDTSWNLPVDEAVASLTAAGFEHISVERPAVGRDTSPYRLSASLSDAQISGRTASPAMRGPSPGEPGAAQPAGASQGGYYSTASPQAQTVFTALDGSGGRWTPATWNAINAYVEGALRSTDPGLREAARRAREALGDPSAAPHGYVYSAPNADALGAVLAQDIRVTQQASGQPSSTPPTTPGAAGTATPAATPGAAGAATPAATPGAAGAATPAATPGAAGATTPAATPGAAGAATPAATPGAAGAATPAATPGAAGATTPTTSGAAAKPTPSWRSKSADNFNAWKNWSTGEAKRRLDIYRHPGKATKAVARTTWKWTKRVAKFELWLNAAGLGLGTAYYVGLQEKRKGPKVDAQNAFSQLAELEANPDKYMRDNYSYTLFGIPTGSFFFGLARAGDLDNGHLMAIKNPDGSYYFFRRVPEDLYNSLKAAQAAQGIHSDKVFVTETIVNQQTHKSMRIQVEIRPPYRMEPLRDAHLSIQSAQGSGFGFGVRIVAAIGPIEGDRPNITTEFMFNRRYDLPTTTTVRAGLPSETQGAGLGIRQQNTTLFSDIQLGAGTIDFNRAHVQDITDPNWTFGGDEFQIANMRAYIYAGNRNRVRVDANLPGLTDLYMRGRETGFIEPGLGTDFFKLTRPDGTYYSLNYYYEVQFYAPDVRAQVGGGNFWEKSGLMVIPPLPEIDPALQLSTTDPRVPRIIPNIPFLDAGHPWQTASSSEPKPKASPGRTLPVQPKQPTVTAPPGPQQFAVVPPDGLNISAAASVRAAVLGAFYQGDFVTATGPKKTDSSGRMWVNVKGTAAAGSEVQGWVESKYLTPHPAGAMNGLDRIDPILRQLRYQSVTVRPGDTLIGIAERWGIDPQQVLELNSSHITDPNIIRAGDVVYKPGSGYLSGYLGHIRPA